MSIRGIIGIGIIILGLFLILSNFIISPLYQDFSGKYLPNSLQPSPDSDWNQSPTLPGELAKITGIIGILCIIGGGFVTFKDLSE